MKHLTIFETNQEYQAAKSEFNLPNVSLIEADNSVIYAPIEDPIIEVGTYVYADMSTGEDASRHDIIGVVVIPSGFAPDGKARMMPIDSFDSTMYSASYHFINNPFGLEGHTNELHAVTSYPYIDDENQDITDSIQGTATNTDGNPWFVYSWVELSAADKAGAGSNSTVVVSPNNPNLCYIQENGCPLTSNRHILPEPYLADGSINPNYAVEDTFTADWDHSNQTIVPTLCSSSLFEAANESEAGGVTGWYVPTANEQAIMFAKFDTIKKAIEATGRTVEYPVDNGYYPLSSSFNQVIGNIPRSWNFDFNDERTSSFWGCDGIDGQHLLLFRPVE